MPDLVKVLITGSQGFIGRNLCVSLAQREDITLYKYDIENTVQELEQALGEVDVVYHLAGVNRPQNDAEFNSGNVGLTELICKKLSAMQRTPLVVLSSSVQAELDNPYGRSKQEAEVVVAEYAQQCSKVLVESNRCFGIIYRLPNVFGKWCLPNYNSVVATWCHNIARGEPIQVNNPETVLNLVYIDDVVSALQGCLQSEQTVASKNPVVYAQVDPVYSQTLGEISELLYSFKKSRETLELPLQEAGFTKKLYATYLAALPEDDFKYALDMKCDERGSFTEFVKTPVYGQVSVNISKPGIVKGNHWHHTKLEKFLVVKGQGVIRFRKVIGENNQVLTYYVSGDKLEVVDIPPGYTHNIENLGDSDMVTVMWASEPFDPARPDTYFAEV